MTLPNSIKLRGHHLGVLGLICALLVTACAPASRNDTPAAAVPAPPRAAGPKVLRMAESQEPRSGIALFGATNSGALGPALLLHSGLTVYDDRGLPTPRLARKAPSLTDGDWILEADGGMKVTWRLRPNVKWHDGAPLTVEDFLLGWRVAQDDQIPIARGNWTRLVSDVTTADSETLVVTWRQPHILANASGPTELAAVPNHLMGELFQNDRAAFINHPYWTSGFVGLGPYRISDWVLGSTLDIAAFDDYFLGRAKIDRIVIRYITDTNTILSTLLADEVDVVPVGTLAAESYATARKTWEANGKGTVSAYKLGLGISYFQYRDPAAPWMDVRVRRALVHAFDRQAFVDALENGTTEVADTLPTPDEPIYRVLEQRGLARYPYDLVRADRLLNEAGWTKGADGFFQNSTGRFDLELRTVARNPEDVRKMLTQADMWKTAGLNTSTVTIPNEATTAQRNEMRSTVPGVFASVSVLNHPDGLLAYHSSQVSSVRTRWVGLNPGGHASPEFDRLFERYSATLEPTARQDANADLLLHIADQVTFLPVDYWVGSVILAVRKGVTGPGPVSPRQIASPWNVHNWDMN